MQTQQFPVGKTFGLAIPDSVMTTGLANRTIDVPAIQYHKYSKDFVRDAVGWFDENRGMPVGKRDGLYICGPSGAGKTSGIVQMFARLNVPVYEITGHSRLETPELLAHKVIIGGDTLTQDGPVTKAYRKGGVFLLNEGDLLDPATVAGLNGIVEGRPLTLETGEVLEPHEWFYFVITANTNGGGDANGHFMGTLRQNLAFLDRFFMIEVDYPDADTEMEILAEASKGFAGYDGKALNAVFEKMIEVAGEIRKLFTSEEDDAIDVTMSTRTLVRWARYTWRNRKLALVGDNPLIYSLDRALGYRAEQATRNALKEIVQRMIPDSVVTL